MKTLAMYIVLLILHLIVCVIISVAFPRKVSSAEYEYDDPVSSSKGPLISKTVTVGGEPILVRFYFIFGIVGIAFGAAYELLNSRA